MSDDVKKQLIKYSLEELTPKIISDTKAVWEQESTDPEALEVETGVLYKVIDDSIDYEENSINRSVFYGIFKEDSQDHAEAFVELIVSAKGQKGMTKMMKLWTNPKYWDIGAKKNQLAYLYASAITETMKKGFRSQHKLIKIYGRNEYMQVVLNSIHNLLHEEIRKGTLSGLDIYFEGRWLTIESI